MNKQAIEQALIEQFNKPVNEYQTRRIVFWDDPDKEFYDLIGDIDIPNVKKLILSETNKFEVKKTLVKDDIDSNFLVYRPLSYEDKKDNWLLDIELYSDKFRADAVSMTLSNLNIENSPQMRTVVKNHRQFFKNKERLSKLNRLNNSYLNENQLIIDLIAVSVLSKSNNPGSIIATVLEDSLNIEDNMLISELFKFDLLDSFWNMTEKYTGFKQSDNQDLSKLLRHIVFNAFSINVNEDALGRYSHYVSDKRKLECLDILNIWMHDYDSQILLEYIIDIEKDEDLYSYFIEMDETELSRYDIFPVIDECIIEQLCNKVKNGIVHSNDFKTIKEERINKFWSSSYSKYYNLLNYSVFMYEFKNDYFNAFMISKVKDLWDLYVNELYKMDYYYRKFIMEFNEIKKSSNEKLIDNIFDLSRNIEDLYKNWYLEKLGTRWNSLVEDEMIRDSRLSNIDQQEEFYNNYVSQILNKGMKVFVIISDALRYEVAKELHDKLSLDSKGKSDITSLQAIYPSATKFGMAALLPHKELQLDDNMNVLVDGLPASNIEQREKILKKENLSSLAISYVKLQEKKVSELRELFKDKQLIYIYHDQIDAVGDKRSSEHNVFDACSYTINDLASLVKKITVNLGAKNVLVTSDHGFIYTNNELSEIDKAEKELVYGEVIENNRRYYIVSNESESEYLSKVNMKNLNTDKIGFSPKNYIRMRKQGGGQNFVHGGVSLQEIVVPVIHYQNIKIGTREFKNTLKAQLNILSQNRKITNNIFKIDFYQDNPISGTVMPAEYSIYLADKQDNPISNKVQVFADEESTEASDRTKTIRLTLRSNSYVNNSNYYLTIVDVETNNIVNKIEYKLEITFSDDFGF